MNGNMNLGTRLSRLENGGGGGSQNNGHVYSTEEQIVGKWTDGSNVYEKVIKGTYTGTNNDYFDTGIDTTNIQLLEPSYIPIETDYSDGVIAYNMDAAVLTALDKSLKVRQVLTRNSITFTFETAIKYLKKNEREEIKNAK